MSQPTKDGSPCAPGVPCDFAHFLVSLGSSALVHLGEVPDPQRGAPAKNLELARHSLQVLHILKHKTAGNLDSDEERLLDALIAEIDGKLTVAASA